jgi:5-methylcytosine-specific restriction endonuclease McrA
MTTGGIAGINELKGGNGMKKPKEARTKREWTPHRYLVAAARKTWRWSLERREVLKKARMAKGIYKCDECSRAVFIVDYITNRKRKRRKIDGAVDHILPIGKGPKKWSDYKKWYEKLFCPIENLQFLCTECHLIKTNQEKAAK